MKFTQSEMYVKYMDFSNLIQTPQMYGSWKCEKQLMGPFDNNMGIYSMEKAKKQ